jgi:hypothetical protein
MADEGVSGISGADEDDGPNAECRVSADDDEGVALHQKTDIDRRCECGNQKNSKSKLGFKRNMVMQRTEWPKQMIADHVTVKKSQ